jgi:hypothetical protein
LNTVLTVGQYGVPPKQKQPGSGSAPTTAAAQGFCINDTTTATIAGVGCWRLLVGGPGSEVISRPDSNDTRMQQVMFANGKLWGSLDTALNPDSGPQRAGIEWFIVNPVSGKLTMQGYLGLPVTISLTRPSGSLRVAAASWPSRLAATPRTRVPPSLRSMQSSASVLGT